MNTVLVTVCLVELRPIHKLHAVSRAPSPTGWILLSKPYQQQPFMVGGLESRESRMAPYASAAIRSIATCWSQKLLAWHPLSRWAELLREGVIDAALVSTAGMAADEVGADAETTGGHCSGSGPWLDRASCGHTVTLLPLGSRPLVLIHAPAGPGARDLSPRLWQLLLPPADHQPQLWRELQRLDLLRRRECSAADCESWLQALLQGPHLLPAHLSLLEERPWREADLGAVPPPDPLEESLWLLVREGEERLPAIDALRKRLQARLVLDSPGMQPMD